MSTLGRTAILSSSAHKGIKVKTCLVTLWYRVADTFEWRSLGKIS